MAHTIRQLTVADAAAYVDIRREMLVDSPASFGSSPQDDRSRSVEAVTASLANPDIATIGAFDPAGEFVGVATLVREPALKRRHIVFIVGVYVRPAWRRRGVCHSVVDAAIRHARAWPGVGRVDLAVSVSAPGAQRVYERLGFVVWGHEPDAIRVGEQSFDERHMTLRC